MSEVCMRPAGKTCFCAPCQSLCRCCGEADEENGHGPAINTGYCDSCKRLECGEMNVGSPCLRTKTVKCPQCGEFPTWADWPDYNIGCGDCADLDHYLCGSGRTREEAIEGWNERVEMYVESRSERETAP